MDRAITAGSALGCWAKGGEQTPEGLPQGTAAKPSARWAAETPARGPKTPAPLCKGNSKGLSLPLLLEDLPGSSPEQVELDSSSLFPQSLSPSQSQRLGMQRLFLHLKRSEGHVCWSARETHAQDLPCSLPAPLLLHVLWRKKSETDCALPPRRRRLRTAELGGFIAVVQAVIVPIALPALLDAAVVLAGKFPGLALRRGDVGWVGWKGKAKGERILIK